MSMLPFPKLLTLMLEAYPCKHFCSQSNGLTNMETEVISVSCRQAIWNPKCGHIPRGFLGATGKAEDVKVIMVCAEPGHPLDNETYDANLEPKELIESCIKHTYRCMKNKISPFHKNVINFLDELFPRKSFDEQLRHVWFTESRLCSIKKEIGDGPRLVCASHYLKRQIELMPQADIVAFGGKARYGLDSLKAKYISAWAFAEPGANRPEAKQSWKCAINELRSSGNKYPSGDN